MPSRASLGLLLACVLSACSTPPASNDDAGRDGGARCRAATECDDGMFCNGAETCDPSSPRADARGCVAGSRDCGADRICDELHDRCATDCSRGSDLDGDGFPDLSCGGTDCDDANPARHPGATEICDLHDVDEDCDGNTYGARDRDHDGADDAMCCNREPSTGTVCGVDCDDTRANVNPTTSEVCDGFDNDCDTATDEGVRQRFYADMDGDDFGDPTMPMDACSLPPGYAARGTDCDDTTAARNPGQAEVCDGYLDNDCNAATHPYDVDGDGQETTMCPVGTDCNDGDPMIYAGAPQRCNRIDDACTGMDVPPGEDEDGDGVYPATATCIDLPAGPYDCDDHDARVRPGVTETCNDVDDDCNGTIDDGLRQVLYPDADDDTHGDAHAVGTLRCPQPGLVGSHDDCDDTTSTVAPGATELCNGVDDDCDATVDGVAATPACGTFPGTTLACASATCTIVSCAAPRADCDAAASNGCEVDTRTDTRHCGGCGTVCELRAGCDGRCRPELVSAAEMGERTTSDWLETVATDGAGNAYVIANVGTSTTFLGTALSGTAGNNDAHLLALDPSGGVRWVLDLVGPGDERLADVATDAAGNVYLLASGTRNATTFAGSALGGALGFVASVDTSGHLRWLTPITWQYPGYLAVAADGSALAIGGFESGSIVVASFDGAGAPRWSHSYGASSSSRVDDVVIDAGGQVIIGVEVDASITLPTGTFTPLSQWGGLLVAYDASGGVVWNRWWDGYGADRVVGLGVDGTELLAMIGAYDAVDLGGGPIGVNGGDNTVLARLRVSDGGWVRGRTFPSRLGFVSFTHLPSGAVVFSAHEAAINGAIVVGLGAGDATAWQAAFPSSYQALFRGIGALPSGELWIAGSYAQQMRFATMTFSQPQQQGVLLRVRP